MALYFKDKPDRREDSNRNRMMSLVSLKNIKDGSEYGIIKKLEFGRNKYMGRAFYCSDVRYGAGTIQDDMSYEY